MFKLDGRIFISNWLFAWVIPLIYHIRRNPQHPIEIRENQKVGVAVTDIEKNWSKEKESAAKEKR
jgi:hypothetical protein